MVEVVQILVAIGIMINKNILVLIKLKKNKEKYEGIYKQAEQFESYIKDSPLSLNEINFDADSETVYNQVLYLCNQGNLEAIEYFLYQKIFKNSGEAWLYILLGSNVWN